MVASGFIDSRKVVIENLIETDFHRFVRNVYSKTTFERLPDKTLNALDVAKVADESDNWIAFDEGVMQCGVSMGIRVQEHEQFYFENCPLPKALIYLHTKESRLLHRNIQRGERNRPEKTIRALECIDRVMPILEGRGCNIIRFDTGRADIITVANEAIRAAQGCS
jgi:hypothetical protein